MRSVPAPAAPSCLAVLGKRVRGEAGVGSLLTLSKSLLAGDFGKPSGPAGTAHGQALRFLLDTLVDAVKLHT